MKITKHVPRPSLVALTVILGIAGLPAAVAAQRGHSDLATAAEPQPERRQWRVPYPGATVTYDARRQMRPDESFLQLQSRNRHYRQEPPTVYFVPVPMGGYGFYPGPGYGYGVGTVTDANGRPLSGGYDGQGPGDAGYGLGTPNLTGAPYVVAAGGMMMVDFDKGTRPVPSCAALKSEQTPNGQPRTIFYRSADDGLVLRDGQRGRVQGSPAPSEAVCYTTDAYGRVVLDY